MSNSVPFYGLYDSPPGSSARGILQARMLEWVAISFSKCVLWDAANRVLKNFAASF